MIKRLAACLLFFLWAQFAGAQWLPLGTPGPGVWLDFGANVGCVSATSCLLNSTAVSLVTTTRVTTTGTATCADAAGNYTQFADNTTRWGAGAGACIEEARTNSVRNNSMQGAVAGSPGTLPTNWSVAFSNGGTLAYSVATVGSENGIDCVDITISGTSGTGATVTIRPETTTAVTAATGQTWSPSAFFRLLSGTMPNIFLYLDEGAGAGFVLGHQLSQNTPTIAALGSQRATSTVTFSGGGTVTTAQPSFVIFFANTTAYNFTLRIGWPQLELGASVSTPIRTTSAAGVRGADVTVVTSPPTFGAAMTGYAKASFFAPTSYGTNQWLFTIHAGSNQERLGMRRISATGLVQAILTSAGVDTYAPTGAAWAQSTTGKAVIAAAASDQNSAFNGTLLGAGIVAMPTAPTIINIGSNTGNAQQGNCQIAQFGLWPSYRMPNAALQTQTTLP